MDCNDCVSTQNLMESDSSAIIDFYPKEFKTDLNGKLQEWEAVVLIPFIVEVRLDTQTHRHTTIRWT